MHRMRYVAFIFCTLSTLSHQSIASSDTNPWAGVPNASNAPQIDYAPNITTIHGYILAKVVWSNFVTLRPGSLYDMRYHFEENLGFPTPTFNYTFFDTGLGAAEPLYPMFESGHQGNYAQLIASADPNSRHLDHFSDMITPDGCRVQSVYIVRGINQFPDQYKTERDQGYSIVDVSWDYTTKVFPGAQCGHHRAADPDPNFDPVAAITPYLEHFKSMDDIPPALLAKYEAKINIEKEIEEDLSWFLDNKGWAPYSKLYSLKSNSLWYYPDGHDSDFGVNTPRPQADLPHLKLPAQFVIPATSTVEQSLPLSQTLSAADFSKYAEFIQGQPTPGYDPVDEPGDDAFSLSQITTKNVLTSGLQMIPITDPMEVEDLVLSPANYRLSSAIVRPYETEMDPHFVSGQENIPELRMVYQLVDPKNPTRAYDQAFIHLNFDGVDRYADADTRKKQELAFLSRLDQLSTLQKLDPTQYESSLISFIQDTISARPISALAFSSSLTGIWVFGRMTRQDGELRAERQLRHGIDYGYYSTAYDNQILRGSLAAESPGPRHDELQGVMTSLIPTFYRDPRRNDPNKITFNGVTCAQCHQMSARDGVHIRLNDGLDQRITSSILSTEYLYRELDRQLTARQKQ